MGIGQITFESGREGRGAHNLLVMRRIPGQTVVIAAVVGTPSPAIAEQPPRDHQSLVQNSQTQVLTPCYGKPSGHAHCLSRMVS